jgi:hypothetical protein
MLNTHYYYYRTNYRGTITVLKYLEKLPFKFMTLCWRNTCNLWNRIPKVAGVPPAQRHEFEWQFFEIF